MKIKVNYDLMDKIKETDIGFSLVRTRREALKYTIMFLPLDIMMSFGNMRMAIISCLFRTGMNLVIFPVIDKYLYPGFFKNRAIHQLKDLAETLRSHYINTDYELLQQSYAYETNYKFIFDENKIPRLKQDKYIMIPAVDSDGEKEVSLVQEHLIGSKDYELSYGSPTKSKVLKPVYNGI